MGIAVGGIGVGVSVGSGVSVGMGVGIGAEGAVGIGAAIDVTGGVSVDISLGCMVNIAAIVASVVRPGVGAPLQADNRRAVTTKKSICFTSDLSLHDR